MKITIFSVKIETIGIKNEVKQKELHASSCQVMRLIFFSRTTGGPTLGLAGLMKHIYAIHEKNKFYKVHGSNSRVADMEDS